MTVRQGTRIRCRFRYPNRILSNRLELRLLGLVLTSNLGAGVLVLASLISRVRLKYSLAFIATWIDGTNVLASLHLPYSGHHAIFFDSMVCGFRFFHLNPLLELPTNCKHEF